MTDGELPKAKPSKPFKPRLILIKDTPSRLVPATALDLELLERYALKSQLEVSLYQRRSLKHHRLYWAILHLVQQNSDAWKSVQTLHGVLMVDAGYYIRQPRLNGDIIEIPSSIAWDARDQAEFNVYFEDAMNVLIDNGHPVPEYIEWLRTKYDGQNLIPPKLNPKYLLRAA